MPDEMDQNRYNEMEENRYNETEENRHDKVDSSHFQSNSLKTNTTTDGEVDDNLNDHERRERKEHRKHRHRRRIRKDYNSDDGREKKRKRRGKKEDRRQRCSSNSDDDSDSVDTDDRKINVSSDNESSFRKKRRKKIKKKSKSRKEDRRSFSPQDIASEVGAVCISTTKETIRKDENHQSQEGVGGGQSATHVSRRMVPMSREEYEADQARIREVYDPESGRIRLVRGRGEIIERIVSRETHQSINQQATRGDGVSFSRTIFRATNNGRT